MGSVKNGDKFVLDGKTNFQQGWETIQWAPDGWYGFLGVGPDGGGTGFKVTATFKGNNVLMGSLRFSGGSQMDVTINDKTGPGGELYIESLILSHGPSKVVLDRMSIVFIKGGNGDDDITTGRGFVSQVRMQQGDNKVKTGLSWVDSVTASDGNDIADIGKGGVGQVLLNNGNNRVTTSDGWFDAIVTRDGDDRAYIGKGGGSSVNLGHGNNIVETTSGHVQTVITYRGEDSVTIGAGGAEFVSLGEGNDTLILHPQADAERMVTIQGGPGSDTIDFSNLKRAISWDAANGFVESREGMFLAMSFENVVGTKGGDELVGNDASNTIDGGKGSDTIAGQKGADDLTGGVGRDVFVFNHVSDSTVKLKGRDLILDFSQTQRDRIDLSALGKLSFMKDNAFSGAAGELRFDRDTDTTIVLADIDGDTKADFAIELDGSIALKQADFII